MTTREAQASKKSTEGRLNKTRPRFHNNPLNRAYNSASRQRLPQREQGWIISAADCIARRHHNILFIGVISFIYRSETLKSIGL